MAEPGKWGKGIYFAKKAILADDYKHLHPDKTRGLLMCLVNLGDEAYIPLDWIRSINTIEFFFRANKSYDSQKNSIALKPKKDS